MYRGITLIILVLLVAAALFAPVSIPYELVSIGSVTPAEEWRLVQDAGGSLSSSLQNFKTGVVEQLNSWQFERGDLSGMEVTNFGSLEEGDTIIRMYSAVIQQQIIDLNNQLNIKRSEQQVLVTGEKPPIVQEAEEKLHYAREALVLREKEYATAKQLFDEALLAKLELVRIQNTLDLARIAVTTAEKTLLVANTGTKPETVGLNNSELIALQKQLDFLRRRNAGYVIRAPFSGVVTPIREPGEVLILQRVDECIVTIPVKVEEMPFINDSARITVFDPMTLRSFSARVLSRSMQTQILGGKSVGFITAVIKPSAVNAPITLGTAAKCTIDCGQLNPRQYLARILRFSMDGG
jgi:hypothetical protein